MAVDSNQGRFSLGYDNMHSYTQHHHAGPHFTNPWTASSTSAANQQPTTSSPIYGNISQHTSLGGLEGLRPQHHQQLPQPIPQQQHHHAQQQHPHLSPISQHQQTPNHHHHLHQQQQQQSQYHSGQQHRQQRLPQPTSQQQQQLPSAPMHRPSTSHLPSTMSMSTTQSQSPHSRTTVGDSAAYRNDLLIATTSAAYPDSTASYSAPSPVHPTATYATATSAPYDQIGYAPATHLRGAPSTSAGFGLDGSSTATDMARRFSQADQGHSLLNSAGADGRRSFQDALEASHGILSLSQDTPRPLAYPGQNGAGATGRNRGSADSYGFPTTHSTSSSVSSTSFNGFYGGGSVDSNISDYSTGGSDMESIGSRRHHIHAGLPSGLSTGMPAGMPSAHGMHPHHRTSFMSSVPPPAQSMMGQFNSKVTNTTQKKHKCKVCDKRFTRPSSLQTHMYSHTGEKRMFIFLLTCAITCF